MIDSSRFLLFFSAALLLALTPGPGILYVLGRTLNGGRKEGTLSSLGTFLGGLVHVLAAAFGLSAILAASATAFQLVRYAGAAYLIYLGITMIRTRHVETNTSSAPSGSGRPLLQGVTTEILNPKTALFFLSFIPQFVVLVKGHEVAQFLLLGSISVSLNTAVDLLVVVFASALTRRIQRYHDFNAKQRTASGVGMIGLGVYVAVADSY